MQTRNQVQHALGHSTRSELNRKESVRMLHKKELLNQFRIAYTNAAV